MIETHDNFWDRTLKQLSGVWQDIAETAVVRLAGKVRPGLPDDDLDRLRSQVAECIRGRGGESLARARAADLGRTYMALDTKGKRRFLAMLARDFDIDIAAVEGEAQALLNATDSEAKRALAASLRDAADPPRLRLFMQFNGLPEGLKFLVDMRVDAFELARQEPVLQRIDDDLRRLLSAWFDVGFLELRRLTWHSPAVLLEKLILYEAVHAISSWQDLKNRLEADRRLFAFFHPNIPEEPLIFVEVALVEGMAANVQRLLDPEAPVLDPQAADAAIFYSISNTQKGLAGVSLGDFLIKRVVAELARELRGVKIFATLSPMPGFRRWLGGLIESGERMPGIDAEMHEDFVRGMGVGSGPPAEAWRETLMALAARYLLDEKRNDRPLDPVARFHLANGARVERINWLADGSPKGVAESAGLMVNYLYRPEEIAANHEAFVTEGRIAASGEVKALARRARNATR